MPDVFHWPLSFLEISLIAPACLLLAAFPLVLPHRPHPLSSCLWISRTTCSSRAGSSALCSPVALLPHLLLAARAHPGAKYMNPYYKVLCTPYFMLACLAGWEPRTESAMAAGLFRWQGAAANNQLVSEVLGGLGFKLCLFTFKVGITFVDF